MNERIRLLAEQATEIVANKRTLADGQIERTWRPEYFNQVFAKLIVEECMELAMTEKSRYANLYNKEADQNKYLTMLHCATSMDNYRLLLKEHFGVEE